MSETLFDELGRIIIDDFSARRPFSSFLPGIAGPDGIPLWVFYVNRGQAITSFGVESKDNPMMEFQPANKAYRTTPLTGFRTFIKIHADGHPHLYEPFSPWTRSQKVFQRMFIGMNELELEERQLDLGLNTNILYFVIPGEGFAGLVRKVTLKNHAEKSLSIEVLDGMPVVIPYGVTNWTLKEISRTIEAWMSVYNLEHGVPFYRLKASTEDKAEVETIEAGHFALSFSILEGNLRSLAPVVDPELVFGHNTALTTPDRFVERPLEGLFLDRQITSGKTPSGFFGHSTTLHPAQSITIYSVFGHIGNEKHLAQQAERLYNAAFLEEKRSMANRLVEELTQSISTNTSSPIFDAYCRQTYLDNVLRGGWPVLLGAKPDPVVYHIYSRKHGDPERDYNVFNLAAEPFSQGEANYRDVNQNRRSDVLFNPQVGDFNIRAFMSLIQADGYNPLVVTGVKFTLPTDKQAEMLNQVDQPDKIRSTLAHPFTPGQLLKHITDHEIALHVSPEDFLASVLQHADHHFEAAFGEGYWVDHWTYNLDLIDSYLTVYPDRKKQLLFERDDLPFYDSPAVVHPRVKKYVLTDGGPRQLGSVSIDPEKTTLIASREVRPHWVRTAHGHGEIYRTTLFAKLLTLALLKFATLDPYGMGVEMEAEKPGWYDAMNGLPGLFGASMPETYALQRLLIFLLDAIEGGETSGVGLPIEVWKLLTSVNEHLQSYQGSMDPGRDFIYWDAVSGARELYREEIRLGFDGREQQVHGKELAKILTGFLEKVRTGVDKAESFGDGVPPTYFTYKIKGYDLSRSSDGGPEQDEHQRPFIRPQSFEPQAMPPFLEGPMRAMRIQPDREAASRLYQQVRTSPLFDRKLKMYKVNAPLADQPHDIGRARAFTPGWLENESIWLHMEYKFLLETLRAGLYQEFFEDLKSILIPFQNAGVYGRSPLENSSFLVSSAHPDEALHGAGFVARLSGATAEFISIWHHMMAGGTPFTMKGEELCLSFKPILPGWLFDDKDTVAFMFLSQCKIVYHNPLRMDTCDLHTRSVVIHLSDGKTVEIEGEIIGAPYAEKIRAGQITEVQIFFEKAEKDSE